MARDGHPIQGLVGCLLWSEGLSLAGAGVNEVPRNGANEAQAGAGGHDHRSRSAPTESGFGRTNERTSLCHRVSSVLVHLHYITTAAKIELLDDGE